MDAAPTAPADQPLPDSLTLNYFESSDPPRPVDPDAAGDLIEHGLDVARIIVERVTIADAEGISARACPRHALEALNGIVGAHVDWPDSKGLNEWKRKALELVEERSQLTE